jgi:hypothetical protein
VQREWQRLAADVAIEAEPTRKPWGLIEMVAREWHPAAVPASRSNAAVARADP